MLLCVSRAAQMPMPVRVRTLNVRGEVWNPDRSRPHSYRPITLAFSLHPDLPRRCSAQRSHVTDPAPRTFPPLHPKSLLCSPAAAVGLTPLSSLPPLPCPPEGAQVGFELLTATEAIGSLKLKRLTGGCGTVAKSLDRSRHQRRLRWQGRS